MLARVVRSFARSVQLGGRAAFTVKTGKEDGANPLEDAGIDHPTGDQKKGIEFPGEHDGTNERSAPADEGYGQNNRPFGQRYSRNNYSRPQGQEGEEQGGDGQRSFQRRDYRSGESGGYQRRDDGGYRSNWSGQRRSYDQQGEGQTQRYNNYREGNRYPRRDYENYGERRQTQGYGERREGQSYGERREGQGYGERRDYQNRYDRPRNTNWVDRNAAEQEKPANQGEVADQHENSRNESSEGSSTPKF